MERRAAAAVFAAALAVRLAAIWWLDAPAHALSGANHEHAAIARNLAEGRGFRFNFFNDPPRDEPTSQQAPWVPCALAACYRAFGVATPAALAAMLAAQAFVGALAAVLCAAAGTSAGGRRYGLALGWCAALYPPLAVAAAHIQALAWNLAWLALLLWAAERARRRHPRAWLWFAVAGAGGSLTDPILAAPAGAAALRLLAGGWPRREFAAAAALAAALLAPWTVRNAAVHGRLMFVKDSLGYVLWQGNVPGSHGTDKLPFEPVPARGADPAAAEARARSRPVDDLLTLGDLRRLSALPAEIDRMDWFAARLRAELAADPWQYPRMCVVRLRQWLWFDETNPRAAVWRYRFCYAALVACAALGLARRAVPSGLAGAWLAAGLALTGVHVLAITSARFRIPAEMLLLAAAAGAFARPAGRPPPGGAGGIEGT